MTDRSKVKLALDKKYLAVVLRLDSYLFSNKCLFSYSFLVLCQTSSLVSSAADNFIYILQLTALMSKYVALICPNPSDGLATNASPGGLFMSFTEVLL